MNGDEYRDRDRIVSYIRLGKDLWDREDGEYERIDNDQDIPKILLDQQKKFSYLLDRDGPNAGFEDYP
jgi:beta-1,4-mannosyl-glycoprotein beta-1,4-N-acetylglucosaminyltransferase